MKSINIVLPNQLFEKSILIDREKSTYIIEEYLFFRQFNFHKQKIYFHRCSMMNYANYLVGLGQKVHYIDSSESNSDIRIFIQELKNTGISNVHIVDPDDFWLEKRIKKECQKLNITLNIHENKSFINSKQDLSDFFRVDKKKYFQTTFYKSQRVKLNLLMNEFNQPEGGKWSFDDQNRLKYPKNKSTPNLPIISKTRNHTEALKYVESQFSENPGSIKDKPSYPTDFKTAKEWFNQFLETRFEEFGPYEDAVLKEESVLNHTVISPLLNSGLLTPNYIIDKIQEFRLARNIPLNSVEGLVRQIIGWREFIRGVYTAKGTQERTTNFWNFNRKIPPSFYNGSTGIEPLDDTIQKIIKTGYANHIERLMIVGNFMLLCEFDPDEVYKWFMELFIDSYDWVMVPNVYGMSQFADGGLMSTKPYISSSNYILKMSNYKKAGWCIIWDSLFWNFMDKHRSFFVKNPRMRMLISSFDKMDNFKKESYLLNADKFLISL